MANGKKTDQNRIDAALRRQQVLELRKQCYTFREIAAQLNISVGQAHTDYKTSMARLLALETDSAEEYRAMSLARLDALSVETWRILLADHPYVSGGKVLKDVVDDGPKLIAIRELRALDESRRKLLGLDAPAKTALTNPDGTPAAYAELRTVVLQLLAPYPDLRLALADQLARADEVTDADQPDN